MKTKDVFKESAVCICIFAIDDHMCAINHGINFPSLIVEAGE